MPCHAIVGSLGLPDRLRGGIDVATAYRESPKKLPLILPSSTVRFLSPLSLPPVPPVPPQAQLEH